jgi:hypothetical protein
MAFLSLTINLTQILDLTQVLRLNRRRSSIYAMFDLLLLLSEGRTMFFGPASQAVRARVPRLE